MKKTKVLYCLTTRGLYSELFNLCLAIVYCEKMGYKLCVNSYFWNAKIEKGWNDYFESVFKCYNNYFSAQDKIYTNERPWIGKIYYKPTEFFPFYFSKIANNLYLLFHPHTLLTKDVFGRMRSRHFIHNVLGENAFSLMAASFRQMYILNNKTQAYIQQKISQLELPDNYIGVHIRKGDKITSQEMQEIHLDKYVNTIFRHKEVSRNVYIATDDVSTIQAIKELLEDQGFSIYYNNQNKNQGFIESNFNHADRRTRYQETINVLLDMEILIHSDFFIGTYTSNLSRVVPFFLGLDKCISLDNDWNIINSMNGM